MFYLEKRECRLSPAVEDVIYLGCLMSRLLRLVATNNGSYS